MELYNFLDTLEQFKDVLGNDIAQQYDKLIKEKRISMVNNMVLLRYKKAYEPIEWTKLKEGFRRGTYDVNLLKGIGGLRKLTLTYFLKQLNYNQSCYVELGSTDPTSDLDFTYIVLDDPKANLSRMAYLYNTFYRLYGNFPDITFDTNFYISSAYFSEQCFKFANDKLRDLFVFQGGDKEFYRLYYSGNNYVNYKTVDQDICFYVQQSYLEKIKQHANSGNSTKKTVTLLKSADIFYDMLSQYDLTDTSQINMFILILRTVYFYMTSSSNESYISDTTYNIIVLGNQMESIRDNQLAYVDNYMFILEWFMLYKSTVKMLEFFDVICKYIVRCNITLGYQGAPVIPVMLVEHAKYWRENIRGKISLDVFSGKGKGNSDDADKIQKGKDILKYLKENYTIQKLYKIFEGIYENIRGNFGLNESTKLVIAKVESAIKSNNAAVITKQIQELSYDATVFDVNSILN